MHKEKDEAIVKKNLEHIEVILSSGNCNIWAAWGTLIKTRHYWTGFQSHELFSSECMG